MSGLPGLRGLAVLALLALSACGSGDEQAAQDRAPALTLALTQYPSTFHPAIDSMAAKAFILGFTRRPIVAYDPDWRIVCLLCTELPAPENGRVEVVTGNDGIARTHATYTLPEAARWGDGTPITTRDVLFSLEVGRHPATGFSNQQLYAREIEDIVAIDEKSFTVIWAEEVCDYDGLGDFSILPAHIEGPIFEAAPERYRERTAYDTDPTNPGLWFGPWRVREVAADAYVVLEANPNWWGADPPQLDPVTIRIVPNTTALEANLLSGEIDALTADGGLDLDQALAFAATHGDQFQMLYSDGLAYEHIDLDLDQPQLADVRVRRALLHAIDREAISRELFGGRQPVAHGSVHPRDPAHNPDLPTYAYDPDRAAALLDAAGWTLGPDGVRRNAEGAALRIPFGTTAANRTRELVQQIIKEQLDTVGVEAEIRNYPARVFFAEITGKRRYDGMAMYTWISAPQNPPRTTLHSEFIPTEENGWSGQNYPGYRSAEMDRLLDGLKTTCEAEPRQALWDRLQVLYAEDLPALPLYFRTSTWVLPPWLEGLRPTGHMYPSSLWATDWRDSRVAGTEMGAGGGSGD